MRDRVLGNAIILLAEDDPSAVRLIREVMKDGMSTARLHVVSDGAAMLDYVFKRGEYAQAPRPDLILLDLNLPKRDGREVLAEIKADPVLRRIPVVVLTTSNSAEDIQSVYDLHANCFVSKPLDYDHFVSVIHQIELFWLSVVQLPV